MTMTDTAFFLASKLIWALLSPDSLLVLLGVGAWVSLRLGRKSLSSKLLSGLAVLMLLVAALPLGEFLLAPLEHRFAANPVLPERVDGIIVLGGAISPARSQDWGLVELGPAAERLTSFHYLAQRYPGAQLVFSGGSGSLTRRSLTEAEFARKLFAQLGLPERAMVYESESRNTYENAANSRRLLQPIPDQRWILVTSAFHMPRAVGSFCSLQWPVIPFPVDHYTRQDGLLRLELNFAGNLGNLRLAMREWAGLIAYRLTGRSSQLLSGDGDHCGATGVS